MISFDDFCSVEGVPTYLQMIRHVKQGLAADNVQNGEKLLSGRFFVTPLEMNPNTAPKAYRQLEEGLIRSGIGAGSHITAANDRILYGRIDKKIPRSHHMIGGLAQKEGVEPSRGFLSRLLP